MPPEGNSESIAGLEKKVDALSKDVANILKSLDSLSAISDLTKKVDVLSKDVDGIKNSVADTSKIEGMTKAVEAVGSKIEERSTTKDLEALESKVSEVGEQLKKVDDGIDEIKDSKETEVLFKKIDDVLLSLKEFDEIVGKSEEIDSLGEKVDEIVSTITTLSTAVEHSQDTESTEIIGKKIDDLQQYVAGLSALEEKVDDLVTSFRETKEIVGIIVRQLDDIERKYNKAAEDISSAVELLRSGASIDAEYVTESFKTNDSNGKEERAVFEGSSKTVDELMKGLLTKVKPQTEAKDMAKALEAARDELTTMITGHTPIIFQFGKRATELKSYPPTATLNENDIARLNKDIRDWTSKLKKIASEK